jgi:hypothetical protein
LLLLSRAVSPARPAAKPLGSHEEAGTVAGVLASRLAAERSYRAICQVFRGHFAGRAPQAPAAAEVAVDISQAQKSPIFLKPAGISFVFIR